MKILYVVNGRMPTTKAYGIQIAQTCQAFIEHGHTVTLVVPRTQAARTLPSLREFYKLRVEVPTTTLVALDWYDRGRIPFVVSTVSFVVSSFFYMLAQRLRGAVDILYTVDSNSFSLALMPYLGVPCFAEIHVAKRRTMANRLFFAKATGIIVLNPKMRAEFMHTFGVPEERFIVEPCGVEASWFDLDIKKEEARAKLNIPQDAVVTVYVGRLYPWKGVDILPAAFALLPDIHCYVIGCTPEQLAAATGVASLPPNMYTRGSCEHHEVPLWQAAADFFVVPWPKNQLPYYEYASPMKLLECMSARRPLISADNTTITSVVPDGCAFLYEPGDAVALAHNIRRAVTEDTRGMVARAYEAAQRHTLQNRAVRTTIFMHERIQ